MRAILFDSSLYIAAWRTGSDAIVCLRRTPEETVWLSSVVVEELYAGSRPSDHHVVERLERDFYSANRLLVPNLTDWTISGKLLARVAAQYHYDLIGRARLVNDALIAMSAARQGIIVLTANRRDFELLAEFRPFRWEIRSVSNQLIAPSI